MQAENISIYDKILSKQFAIRHETKKYLHYNEPYQKLDKALSEWIKHHNSGSKTFSQSSQD